MKTHLRFLLVLVSMMFVLGGCQNPSTNPKFQKINEPPVVETPEDNSNKTKVEFRWGTKRVISMVTDIDELLFENYSPRYLLDLHFNSELKDYAFDFPEGYDPNSYKELYFSENFKKFSDDTFEKIFGTKYYKEGTVIDLKEWTYRATELLYKDVALRLYFSIEDYDGTNSSSITENDFDEIIVGNEDIIVYVFGEFSTSDYYDF